jgi:serine/threonine-protein kinase HipA
MHLKNFSLLKKENEYVLCLAYDLLASKLVVEGDDEELALSLNGKKKKLKNTDFQAAMKSSGLDNKVIENIFGKYEKLIPKWMNFIDNSFLPKSTIEDYKELLLKKSKQLGFKI